MANIITLAARPEVDSIKMNNGLTSVFVSVLSLAASTLATSDRQRGFAAWIASHDQAVFGLGMVGFDIGELPWSPDTFASDREFVICVVEAAKARTGWERLGYEPREEWLIPCLDQFREMVEAFVIGHARRSEADVWPGHPAQLVVCPVHRVYQHEHGCILCNDE